MLQCTNKKAFFIIFSIFIFSTTKYPICHEFELSSGFIATALA
jgi:hypothetical protein